MVKGISKNISTGKIIMLSICICSIAAMPIKNSLYVSEEIRLSNLAEDSLVLNTIRRYIKRHPNYDQFIISKIFPDTFCLSMDLKGIVIGKSVPSILAARKMSMDSLVLMGKTIYIIDSLSEIDLYYSGNKAYYKKHYYYADTCFDPPVNNEITRYVRDALYLYKVNGEIATSNRADTIVFPRRVKSKIIFDIEEYNNIVNSKRKNRNRKK